MHRCATAQVAARLLLSCLACQHRCLSSVEVQPHAAATSSFASSGTHTVTAPTALTATPLSVSPPSIHATATPSASIFSSLDSAAVSHASSPPTAPPLPASPAVQHPQTSNPARKKAKKKKQPPNAAAGAANSTKSVSSASSAPVAAPLPKARTILDFPDAYQPFAAVTPLAEFRSTYENIPVGERHTDKIDVRVGGRVVSMRDMGRIFFLTIRNGETSLQVVRQVDAHLTKQDLRAFCETVRIGDIIGATGTPGRTAKGELSLYASSVSILAPYVCTDQALCPDLKGFVPLTDTDIKYRYRFVDMMSSPAVVQHFRKRHAITRALRNFLDARGFIEVETPVLHAVASGANAKPFTTHHNANGADLFLRVAPELHLKQCVVGGMERVYEIGRVFRNEDADRSHNPEFTTCEFYAAYHTYEDLMTMTEHIMRHLALAANGTTTIPVTSCVTKERTTVDLAQPFRRVSTYDEVQRAAGVDLPPPTELNTPRGMAYMAAIMLRFNIPLPSVRTAAKMFDKLIDYFITARVVEPTFVTDHPLFMSPLAMERRDRPGLSARFELFINGTEYCNAYSELNDPQEQYYRFQQQLLDKKTGDEEAMALDETFLKALQAGLPPTAGWGMGMDRVVMLLNGSPTIRDDIIFPLLRQDTASHDAKRRRKTASFFGFNHNMTLFCLNSLEDEMLKRSAPQDSLDKIRQLRQCMMAMPQRGGGGAGKAGACLSDDGAPRGWRYNVTMAVLRLFCGRCTS